MSQCASSVMDVLWSEDTDANNGVDVIIMQAVIGILLQPTPPLSRVILI